MILGNKEQQRNLKLYLVGLLLVIVLVYEFWNYFVYTTELIMTFFDDDWFSLIYVPLIIKYFITKTC